MADDWQRTYNGLMMNETHIPHLLHDADLPCPQTALRPASQVMRLARMGSFHQSRLSFMRVLLRRLKDQGWRFDRPVFDIDANGVGVAT